MTGSHERTPGRPDTVFFVSDYGHEDEFVGVVHAVLRREAPEVRVVDLGHGVPPFGVRFGAWLLARAAPHLGPGVVLGVVDPGVGGQRRGVALEVEPAGGPGLLVGPDNGLLVPAAEVLGGVRAAVSLRGPGLRWPSGDDAAGDDQEVPATFDGRDVFAPAAAAWCRGAELTELGRAIDPAGLVRVPDPVDEAGWLADGRRFLRAEVTWVDRFGNTQLAATPAGVPDHVVLSVSVHRSPPASLPPVEGALEVMLEVRRVRAFEDLDPGEIGLISDANGRLALVAREASAALQLDVGPGDLVQLVW